MTVRIQVIKTYDVDVPGICDDPIGYAYGLQTTAIQESGKLVDVVSENAEIVGNE